MKFMRSPEKEPRQGVEVSHVRVVVEDAVDSLLLIRKDVVQLPLQLRRLPSRALGRGRGRRGGGGRAAGRVPLGGARVRPVWVFAALGRCGGRRGGPGRGGGARGGRQYVDRLLVRGGPHIWGSQEGEGG